MIKQPSIVIPAVCTLAACLLVIVVWSVGGRAPPVQSGAVTVAGYDSIEALAAAADLVVGTVGGVVARQIDYGTQNPAEIATGGGVPMVFYEVAVTERVKGESLDAITVSGMDLQEIAIADKATPLHRGQQVLLFLAEKTTAKAPGITVVDHWYATKSLDFGIFDFEGPDILRPRMSEAFTHTEFTLSEVRTKIQNQER